MSNATAPASVPSQQRLAFIGGGNMATAIIAGLLRQGWSAESIMVLEPQPEARARLQAKWGVQTLAQADAQLNQAQLVVWAIKPQTFREAASAVAPHVGGALHLSVAAGIRSDSIAQWLGSDRVVRAMPNTPALVGQGITGLYARASVGADERFLVQDVISSTGEHVWVDDEAHLDAVTALSGSGPAYVFYFLEAMVQAGASLGLTEAQSRHLAVSTFAGAATLARQSDEPLSLLRERVTSKGGTTYAALTTLERHGVQQHFVEALHAAARRAKELGNEFSGT